MEFLGLGQDPGPDPDLAIGGEGAGVHRGTTGGEPGVGLATGTGEAGHAIQGKGKYQGLGRGQPRDTGRKRMEVHLLKRTTET